MAQPTTKRAEKWYKSANYSDKAIFQDLTNDLKRYQQTELPQIPISRSALPDGNETPGGTCDDIRNDTCGNAVIGEECRPSSTQDQYRSQATQLYEGQTRPVTHSACPTLWGYTKQKAIGRTWANTMSGAKGRSRTFTNTIIGNVGMTSSIADIPPAIKDAQTIPSKYAIKKGYMYVPPSLEGSTAPKPMYTKSQLSQTTFIPSVGSAADTIWRKQWNHTQAQNDFIHTRKAQTGIGPMVPTYCSEAQSGARYTLNYNNTIREFPDDPERTLGVAADSLRFVPKDMPDDLKPESFTAPHGVMYAKTDSLRTGLAGGTTYLRNITEEDLARSQPLAKSLLYDTRTLHRSSYVPMSELAKTTAQADREDARKMFVAMANKPSPVPRSAPLPMETTSQSMNQLVVASNEVIREKDEANLRSLLRSEVKHVYHPDCARDWACGLPRPRMSQLQTIITETKNIDDC